jgi:hypothetical protein
VFSYWIGVALLATAPLSVAVGFIGGPIDGQSLVLWSSAIFAAWLGIRCMRVCVVVSPNDLRAQNYFHTRSVDRKQILEINISKKRGGEGGPVWMPQVRMTDGSTFWISTLECGSVRKGLMPDRVAMLHEIRRILQLTGRDADGM